MFEKFSSSAPTPASRGYKMPAEWESHAATWLSWPRPDGISFPEAYDKVMPAFAKMVDALADSEPVCINVWDAAHEADVRRQLNRHGARESHVRFYRHPSYEPWCRDHGPVFLKRSGSPEPVVVDWDYNAWGGKYPPHDLDDAVPTHIAEQLGLAVYAPGMILEGGSIEVNGAGTLLTTRNCLLNPNRNPHLNQAEIEQKMRDYLGVNHFLWLGDGIEGDDTDGHIDDLTRFVSRTKVVTVVEPNIEDANHLPLSENLHALLGMRVEDGSRLEVLHLPMPGRIDRDGLRLPASYANFYIANKVVLLPVFNDPMDAKAVAVLEPLFPGREIVPIDCTELIWGLGAFHCLTQQQPA
ncbi:MAG: agmatine deiminase [Verrucomicrobia bacterium]|nr:MAG: agmatine deiminase [Verrucomicrobiota bacterium]